MRLSKKKHPLAVLRIFLGLGQKKLADVAGCSVRTIQAIELLQLKLSEDLALRIADRTNVNYAWLMKGDPKAAPLNEGGGPYCREDYELAQAMLEARRDPRSIVFSKVKFAEVVVSVYTERLLRLVRKALQKGSSKVIDWQIDQALAPLEKRYDIVYSQDEIKALRKATFPFPRAVDVSEEYYGRAARPHHRKGPR